MPRSSRHKQHKQTKHSSKDGRERSDSEEDEYLKSRNGGDENMVRVSRDSASGEKRKVVSQSQDGNNGEFYEDYVVSKRRKEGADGNGGGDRWKGVEEDRGKREKFDGSRVDSEKLSKMKVLVDSNSTKSSRRNEKNAGVVIDSGEVQKNGSSIVESKYKFEKDLRRKEVHLYKDGKEKERGTDRDRKVRDLKHESGEIDLGRKQGSQSGHAEEERPRKRELEHDELQLQGDLRPALLEKELDKRTRSRRDDFSEKEKYQDDASDGNNRGLSMKEDRAKTGKDIDEKLDRDKYREERLDRDKYRDERLDRDKYKDDRYKDRYREDVSRDGRQRDDIRRDERLSRDHNSDRSDIKHSRDESKPAENRHKQLRLQNGDRDGSPHHDDRGTRYRDSKEKKRFSKDNEAHGNLKSVRTPELLSDPDKKPLTSSKLSSFADIRRSQSRHVDGDSTVSSSKWKTSPSTSHFAKEQYRYNTKQADSKYRDSISEERVRSSVVSSREPTGLSGATDRFSERRSLEKPMQKEDKFEYSNERSRRADAQASPKQLMEKAPLSSSIDRRYSNRSTLRQSLDVDEVGGRNSGLRDARDYSANEDRRNRDLLAEKQIADDFPRGDGDTVPVSSSYNRTSHMHGNSSSLLPPPPPRTGMDSTSVLDEDSRGKSGNRYRRYGDPNAGRGMGNAWKGVPSWHPSMPNGFPPYPHGPPPGGFLPVMQQFPAHLFGIRPSMDLSHTGLPYHISEADRFASHGRSYGWRNPSDGACPPHLHGWDVNNGVFGEEPQMFGTPDWDQNRHLMSGRGWETNTEMLKGQNSGVKIELPPGTQKEDHSQRVSSDELRPGQSGQQLQTEHDQPGSCAESIEIEQSISTPPEKEVTEAFTTSCKKADDGGSQFSHVYLSKLDISADLINPEMYNQSIRLLGEANGVIHKVVTEHDYMQERTEAGVKISNSIQSASFFPKINESLFQRAMSLYKKQTEAIKFKHHVASFPESSPEKVLNTDVEKLEPVPTTCEEMPEPSSSNCENLDPVTASVEDNMKDPIPVSGVEKLVEPLPIPGLEKVEATLVSDPGIAEEAVQVSSQEIAEEAVVMSEQDIAEEAVLMSDQEMLEVAVPMSDQEKLEAAVLMSDQMVEEAILVSDKERTEEETFSTSNQDKAEESSTAVQNVDQPNTIPVMEEQEEMDPASVEEKVEPIVQKLEVVDGHTSLLDQASLATADSQCVEQETNRASDCKSDHVPEEQKAFSDAMCGSVGFSEGSSEGCEALMPESIECRLVSLSRIHNFSENTH